MSWSYADPSGITNTDGCNVRTLTTDTQGTVLSCAATNTGNITTNVQIAVKVDKTPPQVTGAIPQRGPDANGWYNHPVAIAFQGSDATSGIDSCTSLTYGGPDSSGAKVSGTCRDRAGNTSAPSSYGLKYDATPPSLSVHVAATDGAVLLRWSASPDTTLVTVARATGRTAPEALVYKGRARGFRDRRVRNGLAYRYAVTAYDVANNATTKTVAALPLGALFGPRPGTRVKAPPLLRWRAISHATYYNVQLIRGHRKILSVWPTRDRFRLHRSWVYQGRRYRLSPGRYRWFVWPGLGSPAANRYGRLLGQSDFVVTR
ncbi:MAG: hypothetical protein WBB74_08615 [Gaiellaceae bacterium]